MRKALAVLFLTALASAAQANGRDPYTVTIHFKRGAENNIISGMTFGLVISHDGGTTWEWMCEKAIGYGGMWDPDYEYTSSDAIFATTFDGLSVMRNRCDFASTMFGTTFVSRITEASNGTLYVAASDSTIGDSKIYKSTDNGMTFPTSTTPPGGIAGDWWQSIEVAPSDPTRVYLTGYRLVMKCTANSGNAGAACTANAMCTNGGMCEPQKEFLLYKSVDSGANYTAISKTGIGTTSSNSTIDIVGISPTDPNTLYVKVTFETGSSGDTVYRSTNGGTNWTPILSKDSKFGLSFLVRYDGTCVAGTRELGAWKSADCATAATPTWTPLTTAPHIGCLYENSAHEVWACTQMMASVQLNIDADGYGIMKSTDLSTWTGVLKYPDIKAPVACAVGTVQNDQCVERFEGMQSPWCCLVPQLGITSTEVDCTGARGCFNDTIDGAIDGIQKPEKPGCCEAGSSGSTAMLSGLVVAGLVFRRRRRPTARR
ncbi:MAG TPA: sialidase family protein [Kofleriaceae bacterium]|nr:sialidase family protein [Kofleriaceae bacterium]